MVAGGRSGRSALIGGGITANCIRSELSACMVTEGGQQAYHRRRQHDCRLAAECDEFASVRRFRLAPKPIHTGIKKVGPSLSLSLSFTIHRRDPFLQRKCLLQLSPSQARLPCLGSARAWMMKTIAGTSLTVIMVISSRRPIYAGGVSDLQLSKTIYSKTCKVADSDRFR